MDAATALTLIAVATAPIPAAKPPMGCYSVEETTRILLTERHQAPVLAMLDAGGNLAVIYRSDATAEWTLTITKPGEGACIVANGTHLYQGAPMPVPNESGL